MKDNKLITLLKLLKKQEFETFAGVIKMKSNCVKVNSKENALLKGSTDNVSENKEWLLLEYLIPFYPKFDSKSLTLKGAFKAAFPNKAKYDLKHISNKISDLTLMLKKFLAERELESDSFATEMLYIKALNKRKSPNKCLQELNALERRMKKIETDDPRHFFNIWQLLDFKYHLPDLSRYNKKESQERFNSINDYLDRFFVIIKLQLGVEAVNRQIILDEKFDLIFLDQCIDLTKSKNFNKPLSRLYAFLFQKFNAHEGSDIKVLIIEAKEYLDKLPSDQQPTLITFLVNLCVHYYQKGETGYLPLALELYKVAISKKLFTRQGYMPPAHFTNIVIIASAIEKERPWAKIFVKKASLYLSPSKRKITVAISNAYLRFEEGKFKGALTILKKIKPKDVGEKLKSMALEVRCIYEIERSEGGQIANLDLTVRIRAYRKFLKRDREISWITKEANLKFLELLNEIYGSLFFSKEEKSKLEETIRQAPFLICRNWLRNKVEALRTI